jgi:hypothetical protein
VRKMAMRREKIGFVCGGMRKMGDGTKGELCGRWQCEDRRSGLCAEVCGRWVMGRRENLCAEDGDAKELQDRLCARKMAM